MNKQKLTYTAPKADTFVVQAEGMICLSNPAVLMLSSDWGTDNKAGGDLILDEGFNL